MTSLRPGFLRFLRHTLTVGHVTFCRTCYVLSFIHLFSILSALSQPHDCIGHFSLHFSLYRCFLSSVGTSTKYGGPTQQPTTRHTQQATFSCLTMADSDFIVFVDDCLNWQLPDFPVLLHRSITDDEPAVVDLTTWMVHSPGRRQVPSAIRALIRSHERETVILRTCTLFFVYLPKLDFAPLRKFQ